MPMSAVILSIAYVKTASHELLLLWKGYMYPTLLIIGILFSAFAQLGLKRVAVYSPFSLAWMFGIATSLILYGLAFVAYTLVLRNYKISVIAPLMTIGVVCIVVLGGMLMGEAVTIKQWVGVFLALTAVLLLMG